MLLTREASAFDAEPERSAKDRGTKEAAAKEESCY